MRITKKHVSITCTVSILMFILIVIPLIMLVHSSLQHEYSIQNSGRIPVQGIFSETIHGFWIPAGCSGLGTLWDTSAGDLTSRAYEMLNFAEAMGYNTIFLTFHRGSFRDLTGDFEVWQNGMPTGELTTNGGLCLDKLIQESLNRGLTPYLYDWGGVYWSGVYDFLMPHGEATTLEVQKQRMQQLSLLWKNLAIRYKGWDIGGLGPAFGNTEWRGGANWEERYASKKAVNWWAPLLQVWLDAVWTGDSNRVAVAAPMTDMGSTATLVKDWWTPELLNISGPIVWRKMSMYKYGDRIPANNPHYPLRQPEIDILNWMHRWDQIVIIEEICGFVASAPNNAVWTWDNEALQWLTDWLAKHDLQKFPWYWESYGWKGGTHDEQDTQWTRAYFTSDGTERPFVNVIRDYLNEKQ